MLKWLTLFLAIAGLVIALRVVKNARRESSFWESFDDVRQVQLEVESGIPVGSPLAAILSYAARMRLECGGPVDRVVYCSARAHSKSALVGRKWLIEFYFDSEGNLERVLIKEGLTGP